MPTVVIYTAPECPHSSKLKEFLKEAGVSAEEKCILTNPETAAELKKLSGQMAIPVASVDGEIFVGFDRRAERRLKRKLGV
ncbi:MAG: glutaredoxin family protein [Promethearchaeota archaeon]